MLRDLPHGGREEEAVFGKRSEHGNPVRRQLRQQPLGSVVRTVERALVHQAPREQRAVRSLQGVAQAAASEAAIIRDDADDRRAEPLGKHGGCAVRICERRPFDDHDVRGSLEGLDDPRGLAQPIRRGCAVQRCGVRRPAERSEIGRVRVAGGGEGLHQRHASACRSRGRSEPQRNGGNACAGTRACKVNDAHQDRVMPLSNMRKLYQRRAYRD